MRRWALIAMTSIAASMLSGSARASAKPRLIYERAEGAESCPDERGLREAIAERLGREPFDALARSAVVRVAIVRDDAELVASIQREDDAGQVQGKRELRSGDLSCTPLVDAVSLTVSVMVDAARADDARPPPAARVEPVSPGTAALPPPDRASDRAPLRLRVGALAMVGLGASPGPAFGVGGLVGLTRPPWSIDLEGRVDLPASKTSSEGEACGGDGGRACPGVQSSLTLGSVVPCYRASILRLCGIGSFGALRAEGIHVGGPRHDASFFAALGARASFEIPITGPIRLRVHSEVQATLTSTTLSAGGTDVWTSAPVIAGFGGGPLFEQAVAFP